MRVGREFDRQIVHIHGAAIPLQPEAHLLRPYAIFHKGIGPEIVPLLTHAVAAFAHRSSLPPTHRLSCRLRQAGKKAVRSHRVLDQCTQLRGEGYPVYPIISRRFIIKGFLGSTPSWYQSGLDYRSSVLIFSAFLMHVRILYA